MITFPTHFVEDVALGMMEENICILKVAAKPFYFLTDVRLQQHVLGSMTAVTLYRAF